MLDNVYIINVLKERVRDLEENDLQDTEHYRELVKQIEMLSESTPTVDYVYPGSDCQDAL